MNAHTPTKIAPGFYVDHSANEPKQLSVSMVGRKYRVVMSWVVNGHLHEEPVDDLWFDSVNDARKHRRELAAKKT